MKAAIYTPYLNTLGGGERYVISFAKVLADKGWNVELQSEDSQIIEKLSKRFGLKLDGIRIVDDIKRGDGYDLCFWLSDGSIPNLLARKNILHFQRPFYNVDGKSLINRMKFFRINKVIVNSQFTKKWIDNEYPVNSIVLYPPVSVDKFKSHKKEDLILCVARFSQLEQSKRQDVLVEVFKKFYDSNPKNKNWKLVLAGGSEVGGREFADSLNEKSKDYPIKILENPGFRILQDLYGKAKIFWSASGFGMEENKNPEKMEHFGITTVEAMSAKCIPIIYNAGGSKEIVQDGYNGFLWNEKNELLKCTEKVINDPKVCKNISTEAYTSSKKYGYERFSKEVSSLL